MKRIVFALGIIDVLIGFVLACMAISDSLWIALIVLAITVLTSVPFFALAGAMEHIEELQEQIRQINGRLNKLRTDITPAAVPEKAPLPGGRTALCEWSCPKCGAVNKTGTDRCDSCGAVH